MESAGGLSPGELVADLVTGAGLIAQTSASISGAIHLGCFQITLGDSKEAHSALLVAQSLLLMLESDIKFLREAFAKARAAGRKVLEEDMQRKVAEGKFSA